MEFFKDERKLKPTTLVAHIIVVINVVKFNISKSSPALSPGFSPVILTYQSFQRQFQREGIMLAKRSKEGLTSKSTKQFYFEHVLEILQSLRDKYFEPTVIVKNRNLHDLVLLATFVRGIPGRCKQLRKFREILSFFNKMIRFSCCNLILRHQKRLVLQKLTFRTTEI